MLRAALLLGAAVALFFASFVTTTKIIEITKPETVGYITLGIEDNFRAKYKAWFQACDYSPYTCFGVLPPHVVSKPMRRGLLGYYDGGDTIYVNYTLKGQALNEVLMHEMIHYLQKQVGGLPVPGPANLICAAEEEAFTLVDQWLREHGYWDLTRGPQWWKPYRHCWQFYGPNAGRMQETTDWYYTH